MTGTEYRVDWLTTNLAVGHAPMSYDALDRLHELGIGTILNLCAEFCDLHSIEANAGFEVYYLPIADEEAPDPEELEKALDWLDECLYLGKRVLVHCRFGIGRTGTVVNAYLLRKGLGHKLAGKKLKGLRAQPANFDQWRFIRKYAKKEKKLTIREPSLESRNKVNLLPFLLDYEKLVSVLDQRLDQKEIKTLCGLNHATCCQHPVFLSLIETIHVNHFINLTLSREVRSKAIERALSATTLLREAERRQKVVFHQEDPLLSSDELQILCPLSQSGKCLIFANRPLTCRLFDLSTEERHEIMESLGNKLEILSENIYFALTSRFPGEITFDFFLGEVVSGRFVQKFFRHLQSA